MLRVKIFFLYLFYSIRYGTYPWKYFQINAEHFSSEKGIFSKYEIEEKIGEKWKLNSFLINKFEKTHVLKEEIMEKFSFPLFLKPEWGQNSHGIIKVDSETVLINSLKKIKSKTVPYYVQELASRENEYDILFVLNPDNIEDSLLSITQVFSEKPEKYPINGIHSGSMYMDISSKFSDEEIMKICETVKAVGDFKFSRIGIRADNTQSIVSGNFKIFEINLFIPLPLIILDKTIDKKTKNIFLNNFIKRVAYLTKKIKIQKSKSVFFSMTKRHYLIKFNNSKTVEQIKKYIYSKIEKYFLSGCSDYNSLKVRKSSRSKKQARDMFAKHSIPHAKGSVFLFPWTGYSEAKRIGFPLVMKPNISGYSRGSQFPIKNWKEFWKAMFFVKLWWPTTAIESYLLGKNYRVVVTKEGVQIAMRRYSPYVDGDGESTILELINAENKTREKMNLYPVIHPLSAGDSTIKYLKKQGLTIDSIPKSGERIELFNKIALAPGGVLENIDLKTIPQKNLDIFNKILNVFDSNIFGIDVIMEKGIEFPYDEQKTIFLEVNSRPYLKMHSYPRFGEKPDLTDFYNRLEEIDVEGKGVF